MKLQGANLFFFHRSRLLTYTLRRLHSTGSLNTKENVRKIRNIGIMAHIDAGKTTTTERMLYYSGIIHAMGEVHHGNTITDYLDQERDRGITITSASVTVPWNKHKINIIDTPGHIDFTFEVEQSLNVIDGAIIILDGSAGVEPQTVTVWNQADKYNVPRIVYVNKMDRLDSSLEYCLESLTKKFDTEFFPIQVPIKGTKTGITAIIDIINRDVLIWSGEHGEMVSKKPLTETEVLYEKVEGMRNKLVDRLGELDDELMNIILKYESLAKVDSLEIDDALRRVTVARKGVPVVCGSSYKNIGVQKLLDAIVNILPSPDMRRNLDIYRVFGGDLCAKAFKVSHDTRKGPITFMRVYSGSLTKGQKMYNVNRNKTEQVQKIYVALADDYEEVKEVTEGNIAAVTGLKHVCSGDIVTSSASCMKAAVSLLAENRNITESESEKLLFPQLLRPDPVFFCSIESPSPSLQSSLDVALEELQKEDPSLQVKVDPDTMQTVLGGMGELHLEIIKDRIKKKYNIDVDVGPLQIAYKEKLMSSRKDEFVLNVNIASASYKVKVVLSILPKEYDKEPFLTVDKSVEAIANTSLINSKQIGLIKNGVETAILHGPKVGCPVINTRFIIHHLECKKFTPDSIVSSAAAQCAQKLLTFASTVLIEPYMRLEVVTDNERRNFVMSDLATRRAEIFEFTARRENSVVRALVPLSELLGYSKALRIGTSGNAVFSMEFDSYREVPATEEREAIKDITGFYTS